MRTCDDFGILDRQKTFVNLFVLVPDNFLLKTLKENFEKKVVEHGYN